MLQPTRQLEGTVWRFPEPCNQRAQEAWTLGFRLQSALGGSPPLPTSPVAPVTHIPPYAPVDWLHEEGGEEATQVHHQRDGGNELLWRERQ